MRTSYVDQVIFMAAYDPMTNRVFVIGQYSMRTRLEITDRLRLATVYQCSFFFHINSKFRMIIFNESASSLTAMWQGG